VHSDFNEVHAMMELAGGSHATQTKYREWLEGRTFDFLDEPPVRSAVEALVDALVERRTLGYAEAALVMERAMASR